VEEGKPRAGNDETEKEGRGNKEVYKQKRQKMSGLLVYEIKVTQLLRKYSAFCGSRNFIIMFTKAYSWFPF
jgi:hypothetical protein